jgi:hypothetical protein
MNARTLARRLGGHAARMMASAEWGEAMRNELDEIDDDVEALRWAIGSVLASYRERLMSMLDRPTVRWLFAFLVVVLGVREFFAPALTFAYRFGDLPLAQTLGGFTPGDDYRRFIPLMEATPLWLLGMWVASGATFLASAMMLVWKRQAAFLCFVAAVFLEIASGLIARTLPEYQAAFSFGSFRWVRDAVIPAAQITLPLAMTVAFWAMTSRGRVTSQANSD